MTRKTIDEHVRDHYRSQALSPEMHARLGAMAELRGDDDASGRRGMHRLWPLAATLAALALSAPWLLRDDGAALSRSVAAEIAMNHVKRLDVEFALTDPSELSERMERLDFEPVWDERLDALGARLVGSRYCSLGGQIAAQIVLVSTAGERLTLYQTRDTDELHAVDAGHHDERGVRVELWRGGGVLVGLASSAD